MKLLLWTPEPTTHYWATRVSLLPDSAPSQQQFQGHSFPIRWFKDQIPPSGYPDFCLHPNYYQHADSSPKNIIRCFREGYLLQGLTLVVIWGGLRRTKHYVYQTSLEEIEAALHQALKWIEEDDSLESVWCSLRRKLRWSPVMSSKCLHFMARSLGYEHNPPVPIDNAVILNVVWPKFKAAVKREPQPWERPLPKRWKGGNWDWPGYNRYMTAIMCWAEQRGWTTTKMENTIFKEYRFRKDCAHQP